MQAFFMLTHESFQTIIKWDRILSFTELATTKFSMYLFFNYPGIFV